MAIWSRFFGSSVSTAAGYGMGSTIGPALRPVTQAVANEMWEKYPDKPLSPEELAEAVVRGLMEYDAARDEARMSGINGSRFAKLHGLAGQPPAPEQMLELWNRGVADNDDVDRALRQSRLRPEWFAKYKALRRVLVPVSDLVRFAVREVFDPEARAALSLDAEFPLEFATAAALLGLSEQDAKRYWAAHWNLPSLTELAVMLHRKLLTPDEFRAALKALDYAPTWRAKLEAISAPIPPLQDMIRFAVREVYDPAKRAALGLDEEFPEAFADAAELHGFAREYAEQEWAAHWRLPSATQGYEMLHRGEIELPELDGLLKALDYPKLWRNRLRNIAYRLPGRVDLRRMLAEGVIDRATVKRGYLDLGYTDVWAERLTDFAVKLANKSSASTRLTHTERAQQQLWTRTHTSYLAGEITEAEAREKLPKAGVPADEVSDVLAVWNLEREVERLQLSKTEVKKAWAKAVKNPATGLPWTRDEAVVALVARGLSANDANTFLDL